MPGKLKTADHHLLARRCVQCGCDDHLIAHGDADHCPRCQCDFQLRPPRSYAEMEGLLGHPITLSSPRISAEPGFHGRFTEESLVQRWLAVLFCAMVLVVMIVCLSAAAVPG